MRTLNALKVGALNLSNLRHINTLCIKSVFSIAKVLCLFFKKACDVHLQALKQVKKIENTKSIARPSGHVAKILFVNVIIVRINLSTITLYVSS